MPYRRYRSVCRRPWLPGVLLWAICVLGCDDRDRPTREPEHEPEQAPGQAGVDAPEAPPRAAEAAAGPALDVLDRPADSDLRPRSSAPDVPAMDDAPRHALAQPRNTPADGELDLAAFHAAEAHERSRKRRSSQEAAASGKPGRARGRFEITYYWMAHERDRRGPRDTRIYTTNCKSIARVSRAFAARLGLEGTGMLRDGRIVNVAGACECASSPCFFVVSEDTKRWGVGVSDRPLSPFRSVAVDPSMVSIGTKLYIPELDGLTMPGVAPWGGFVHDGCVIADDRGGAVAGKQLDFFMVRRPYYQAFHRRHRIQKVSVFDGGDRCARERTDLVPVDRNSI